MYWLLVTVLLAIAFFVIIPPLWKNKEIEQADSDQRNIKIARERAKELKQQLESDVLTQIQFDEQYSELELTLGDDLDIEKSGQDTTIQGRWVIPVIVIFLPLFSVLTYLVLGEPNALAKAQIQQTQITQQAKNSQVDVGAMVAGLAERLKQDPGNAQGWLMLGRSYKHLKQYQNAANALEKAYALLGDQPEVMLQYADALAMANDGRLSGKAADLIFKALEKSPNDVTGLWLAGMAKAEMSEFDQALQYWTKLEKLLPPESDSYREIQGLIALVQAKVTGTESPVVEKAAVSKVNIDVQVSVAEAIKSKLAAQDTVFIYAKALTGPPMPLAIVRKQVSDLPLSVTLDDAMAMMPTMKLSSFQQVKVVARISKSGSAMQQKGDFIGSVEIKELAGKVSVVIVINEEV